MLQSLNRDIKSAWCRAGERKVINRMKIGTVVNIKHCENCHIMDAEERGRFGNF